MKTIYYIAFLLLSCAFAQEAFCQETQQQRTPPRQRNAEAGQSSDLPTLSVRATSKNAEQTKNIDNVVWLREIYRYIDVTKDNNAALYYPIQPIGDRMNLFTLIFKLMAQGKVTAYTYRSDGLEIFNDQNKEDFEKVLKRAQVLYTTKKTGTRTDYVIEDSDIPSNEVTIYMIKEAWYFDQATGTFNSKVLSICPMLVRQEDDFGTPIRTPLFWIPYENIRPYISRTLIMTSNINNAMTYTIDDYFTKRMYNGEIVKTTNLMGQSLAQQIKSDDPAALKHAQDSIEGQLKFFEEKLWVPKDTTQVVDKKKGGSSNSKATKEDKKEKEKKPKEAKPDKSSSTPTKSVRRTR